MKTYEDLENDNGEIVAVVSKDFIQEYMEANYGFKLSQDELNELKWLIWEEDYDLITWIDDAVQKVLTEENNEKGVSN